MVIRKEPLLTHGYERPLNNNNNNNNVLVIIGATGTIQNHSLPEQHARKERN
jgi:hypothetical protein